MLRRLFRAHSRWEADVDAFVDGELASNSLARFEAHRARCERCGVLVSDALRTKSLLRTSPEITAPRSFRLTAAMVAPARPMNLAVPSARPAFVFRGALATTAMAAAAFVISIVVGTARDSGGNHQLADAISFGQETSLTKSAAPIADQSTSRSAAEGAADAPKLANTTTPFVPSAPTRPAVGGASAGGATSELVPPGASPQPPATGVQRGSGNPPASANAGGASAATAVSSDSGGATSSAAPPLAAADFASGDSAGVAQRADTNRPAPGPSDDAKGIHRIQLILGVITLLALAITGFAAIGRRGRNHSS